METEGEEDADEGKPSVLMGLLGEGKEDKMAGGPWLCSENNNQGPRGTATFLLAGKGELGEGGG
jgi:hypothetical protein